MTSHWYRQYHFKAITTFEKQACEHYQWVNLKPECRNNFSRIVLSWQLMKKRICQSLCLAYFLRLRGGDGGVKNSVVKKRNRERHGNFCDSSGRAVAKLDMKAQKSLTKGKCPGNNRISYISIPEGCTVVVRDKDAVIKIRCIII